MEEVAVIFTLAACRNHGRRRRCAATSPRSLREKVRGKGKQAALVSLLAMTDSLSFFVAIFAPVKFERSAERLAETLLR